MAHATGDNLAGDPNFVHIKAICASMIAINMINIDSSFLLLPSSDPHFDR